RTALGDRTWPDRRADRGAGHHPARGRWLGPPAVRTGRGGRDRAAPGAGGPSAPSHLADPLGRGTAEDPAGPGSGPAAAGAAARRTDQPPRCGRLAGTAVPGRRPRTDSDDGCGGPGWV